MAIRETLRDGSWITERRLVAYPLILLVFYAVTLALVVTSGAWKRIDLGVDFSCFWSAAIVALTEGGAKAYEGSNLLALQHSLFVFDPTIVEPFVYPPTYLLLILPFGLLPLVPSLVLWTVVGFAVFLFSLSRIVPGRRALVLIAAFPGAWAGAAQGQNGLLLAACFAGGLVLMDRRPWLAGLCFALLADKPQLAAIVPLALVMAGRWRVLGWTAGWFLAVAAAATSVFGLDAWTAFLEVGRRYSHLLFANTAPDFATALQSTLAVGLNLGLPIAAALALQATVSATAVLFVLWLWRRPAHSTLKAAGLVLGALLATPYLFHYDLPILGVALAFLAAYGLEADFAPWEKSLLAAAWCMPLAAGALAKLAGFAPMPFFGLALLGIIARHALSDAPAARLSLRASPVGS